MNLLKTILLATAVISALTGPACAADSSVEQEKFLPIKLLCPSQPGNGILESILQNKVGWIAITRVIYKMNKATVVTISSANAISPTVSTPEKVLLKVVFATKPLQLIDGYKTVAQLAPQKQICEADALTKTKYFNSLKNNKTNLESK